MGGLPYELNRLAALEASGMTLESAQTILNDPQAKSDYENWNGNGNYQRAANIIIAAIGGSSAELTSAITKESLSWAADVMRQKMIEDSKKFNNLCASENDCINNASGVSVGVNGDNFKLAGGRIVLEKWCEIAGAGACQVDPSTKSGYAESSDGSVIFKPKDAQGNDITIKDFIAQNQNLRSPLGGVQGSNGQMALGVQFEYSTGDFWDRLAEAYSGTHDTLNSFIWYDQLGNGKQLDNTLRGHIGEAANKLNVLISTPFAASILLPPEVFSIILQSLKNTK